MHFCIFWHDIALYYSWQKTFNSKLLTVIIVQENIIFIFKKLFINSPRSCLKYSKTQSLNVLANHRPT